MRVIPVLIRLVIAVTGLTVIGIGVYGKTQSEPYLDLLRNDRLGFFKIIPNMGFLMIFWGKYKIFKNIAIKLIAF